jgi:uncharacterized protein
MKIEGSCVLQVPVEELYEALQDEQLIRDALPGRVYFLMRSPTTYEAAMELDVPRFGGHYSGVLEVVETEPPRFFRLYAEGQGPDRDMQAGGIVELVPLSPYETEVYYAGETNALDGFNPLIRMAAPPVAVRLVKRGLHHLEQAIHQRNRRGRATP